MWPAMGHICAITPLRATFSCGQPRFSVGHSPARGSMYQRYQDGQLFVVRWRQPTVESERQLGDEVEQRHEQLGEPLLMGVIIGPDCVAPDAATREALLRGHDRVYDFCSSVRMVFIGGTLRQTVMRSVVTGITIATGMRGKGVAVERSVAGLAKTAEQMLGTNPHALLAQLAAVHMLDEAELASAQADLRR